MTLHKLADDFLKLCLADDEAESRADMALLLKINTSQKHYVTVSDLTPEEKSRANYLTRVRYLDLIPAGTGVTRDVVLDHRGNVKSWGNRRHHPNVNKLPERYVLTSGGTHKTDTFKFDTLSEEDMREYVQKQRMENRQKKSIIEDASRIRVMPDEEKKRVHVEDMNDYLDDDEDNSKVQINKTLNFALP